MSTGTGTDAYGIPYTIVLPKSEDRARIRERKLQWRLAEAECVIDLMLDQCSVPCDVDHAIQCSIVHLPEDLIVRASAVFKEYHMERRKAWLEKRALAKARFS